MDTACDRCASIDLDDPSTSFTHHLLGSQRLIASASAGCHTCSFFLDCVQKYCFEEKIGLPDAFGKENVDVQIRRLEKGDNRVELRVMAVDVDEPVMRIGLRLCSSVAFEVQNSAEVEVQYHIEPDTTFPGRLISRNSGDDACLDLAYSWLQRCSLYHGRPCFPQTDGPLPTRLIYIPQNGSHRLTLENTEGKTGKYVALSHCWGDGIGIRTLKKLLSSREAGFMFETLPESFKDAVVITRRLGFSYLWIDALCIIQDCPDDWVRESSRMAEVYGYASLTICAQLAPNGRYGFLRDRGVLHSPPFGKQGEFRLQTRDDGWANILTNPLNDRGWTHQERFVAPRKLHFLREQLAWECPRAIYLEEYRGNYRPGTHFSVNLFKHFHEGVANTKVGTELFVPSPPRDMLLHILDWNHCVEEWTTRNFTYPSDMMPSLSGLANAAEVPGCGAYLAGLWESNLFMSLGYHPPGLDSARTTTAYRGPSWSWPTWDCLALHVTACAKFKHLPTPEWYQWAERFEPKLIGHSMVPKNSIDPRGELLEGSHIIFEGFCRPVWLIPDSKPYNPDAIRCKNFCLPAEEQWDPAAKAFKPHILQKGRHVRFDQLDRQTEGGTVMNLSVHFGDEPGGMITLELADRDAEPGRLSPLELAVRGTFPLFCVQISRQWREHGSQVIALVLDEVLGAENEYKRVGILAFDDCDLELPGWEAMKLKLV